MLFPSNTPSTAKSGKEREAEGSGGFDFPTLFPKTKVGVPPEGQEDNLFYKSAAWRNYVKELGEHMDIEAYNNREEL